MNQLVEFKNEQFGKVRTLDFNGEPWFIAADLCNALGIINVTMAIGRLDKDEKAKLNLGLSGGKTNCVNETGMYALVLQSRKPGAKSFKRWITHEVVPSIRKTGFYVSNQAQVDGEDTRLEVISNALILAQDIIKEKNARILELETEMESVKRLNAHIPESMSVLDFGNMLIEMGINMGRNKLYDYFRKNQYVYSGCEQRNLPTKETIDQGLMEVKYEKCSSKSGIREFNKKTYITPKGQQYFLDIFRCM